MVAPRPNWEPLEKITLVTVKFTLADAVLAVTVEAWKESTTRLAPMKPELAKPFESVAADGLESVPEPCVIAHVMAAPATGCPAASVA